MQVRFLSHGLPNQFDTNVGEHEPLGTEASVPHIIKDPATSLLQSHVSVGYRNPERIVQRSLDHLMYQQKTINTPIDYRRFGTRIELPRLQRAGKNFGN
jgi:hypothetical protein